MKLVDLPKGTLFQRPSSEKPGTSVEETLLVDGQYAINPDSVTAIRRSDSGATVLYCANARFIIPHPESAEFMKKLLRP